MFSLTNVKIGFVSRNQSKYRNRNSNALNIYEMIENVRLKSQNIVLAIFAILPKIIYTS